MGRLERLYSVVVRKVRRAKQLGLKQSVKRQLQKMYYWTRGCVHHFYHFMCKNRNLKQLHTIISTLKDNKYPPILYPPFMSWNIPMFQRPQHLAIELGNLNIPYLYFSNNSYDTINKPILLGKNTYVIGHSLYREALRVTQRHILFLHPNHSNLYNREMLDHYLAKGCLIIYDFLDDLNPEVFGYIDAPHYQLHQSILADERIICLASSDVLYQEALRYRQKNLYFVPNAADVIHFTRAASSSNPKIGKAINRLLDPRKKTIGYFGALAKWVDFKLIFKIAERFTELQILLIGGIYDEAFQRVNLKQYPSILYAGCIPYKELPYYACRFDISIIPFLVNATTKATSPIKLFEYMALGKPIITTALPECKKYKSAKVAHSHDEFLNHIQDALALKADDPYFHYMKAEADANSWQARANIIAKAIDENLVSQ